MRRKPAIKLETFPADPPSLPGPPQAPDGGATHRQAELRARALELAIRTTSARAAMSTVLGEAVVEAGDPLALADQYLAYINGDQP